ncbi:MAG: pyocin knob domain-containing protein [Bilophila wadsworthia]|uniref:pyocin knob domain-containing protein n=1 Tax=Bilophila wadsworthia TaxID=35833 RepID=UPI00242CA388|nr:pyocin knob domain-containing protein [Bilophila wadsworthia]MCI6538565.1 pyocin knob domain-containing protein [Bilophila wadsworthia]MDY3680459.1 pyocin knob domain-containing protein [Bilophila wadsworthia]
MAISWSGAVALANKIASDVPAIKTMLDALAKMDFTGITGIPANVKRIASVTGGVQIQKYASNAWATVGKLMHDVDTVDGKHAATGTTANTIPVRDASGKLPGDITGNAATASKASALADGYTVPLAKGGTGATTAAAARANLGADNAANITKGTLSTARGGTGRTDGFVTDVVIDASGTKASEVGQLGRAKSLTSVDANTILKQGRYNVYKATTALNFPIAGDMLLDVIYWGDNNITQRCSSAGNSYKFEMSRSSYDNGATWGGWLPVSGFLNSDVHIYVAKNGSDTNSGYTSDKPVLTLGMAIYKMLMMKPGVGRNIVLHFGPGDWGDFTLHKFYSSGAAVVMTTLAGANATSAPPDMPKFGTITVATGAVVYLRNIEADRVACSYLSRIHAQYYNTIGAVVSAYGGRFFFDSSSVTGIKAQSIQTSSYFYVYRHGLLDINGGATFDVLEAVSYSSAFLYAGEYSEVNIGSTSFANAGRVTGKRFNLTNALLTDGNRNNHLLFPGTAAGVYGYGNIINGYATDLAIGGDTGDLTSKRGQIGDAVIVGTVDFNTLVKQGVYSPEANSTNGPNFTSQQILAVYQRNVSNKGRRVVQLAFNTSSPAAAIRTGLFTTGTEETPTSWSDWVRLITAATLGDGLQISSDGIVSVERRVEIPSGTRMLFQQTNAPTGWTKITVAEYNNAALRLVTGNVTNYTAGLAFSTAFATGRATTATAGGGSVGSTTLTTAQMPKHKHSVTHYIRRESGGDYKSYLYAGTGPNLGTMTCAEAGGSGAHTHSFSGISHSHALNLNVKYIDFIVAQKA